MKMKHKKLLEFILFFATGTTMAVVISLVLDLDSWFAFLIGFVFGLSSVISYGRKQRIDLKKKANRRT